MKTIIETALASAMQEAIAGLSAVRASHDAAPLPDFGTSLVVKAEIEHRGGCASLADVTFRVETPVPEDAGAYTTSEHGEIEHAVRHAAESIDVLYCGQCVTLHGKAFFQGQGGGVDGNRWVSELTLRYGVTH